MVNSLRLLIFVNVKIHDSLCEAKIHDSFMLLF